MALLAERRIPLGVCPSSNVALGLYRSLGEQRSLAETSIRSSFASAEVKSALLERLRRWGDANR
jgi:adenosine deaminase